MLPPLAGVGEVVYDQLDQALLRVTVAGAALSIAIGPVGGLGGVGEELQEGEDAALIRILGFIERRRVGHDAHRAFLDLGRLGEYLDGIAVALAHFLAVDARHECDLWQDSRLGQRENLAVTIVEPLGNVARDLDVLFLVRPDRDDLAAIGQNVRGHQHGICKEAEIRRDAPGDLVLIGVGQFKPRDRHDDAQMPGQLGNLGNIALAEECDLLAVEAEGEVVQGDVHRVLPQEFGVLDGGHRVVVGDEVETLVAVVGPK